MSKTDWTKWLAAALRSQAAVDGGIFARGGESPGETIARCLDHLADKVEEQGEDAFDWPLTPREEVFEEGWEAGMIEARKICIGTEYENRTREDDADECDAMVEANAWGLRALSASDCASKIADSIFRRRGKK